MFDRWNKYAILFLKEHSYTINDVKNKVLAWNIAERLNITLEAYKIGMNDSNIESALKRIFPYAWKEV